MREMDLDHYDAKHWYYKLKREYEAEEKLKRKLEQKQAKKEYK